VGRRRSPLKRSAIPTRQNTIQSPRTSRQSTSPIPPDDLKRNLTLAQPDKTESLRHIGLVGDTYTILLAGADTAGHYCVIDMHIPPGGGPPPHNSLRGRT
jgi:hypothetical protein